MTEAAKIFVGCAANNEDLESLVVLESSLRRYATIPVDIVYMRLSRDPESPFYQSQDGKGWDTSRWSTPFSGFRWAVPFLNGGKGRAIYTDSDVIWKDDVKKLWNAPMDGAVLMAKGGSESWRYCVTMFDCAKAVNFIPPIKQLMAKAEAHANQQMYWKSHQHLRVDFPTGQNWNCIDGEDYKDINDPAIKILHYSSEAHQPHLIHAIPRLKAEGKQHWFDGKVKPHWRKDVVDLFDYEFKHRAYEISRYVSVPFGPYKKASNVNYTSHKWAR